MWICPKCGREFRRTNQSHYCGEAPGTVLEYIALQSAQARPHLTELRSILLHSVPGVSERIAWSMPYYEKDGKSISFSACKNHVSLYAGEEAIQAFSPELKGLVTKKSAVYFPYDTVLPVGLIEKLVKWCLT